MRIRPRAVIFDYGNVLSAPQGAAEVEAMASMLQVPVDSFRKVYWQFRVAYDEAALDPAGYWRRVSEELSRRLGDGQIPQLIEIDSRSWAHPAPLIPEWARKIREAGLITALLSNMPTTVRDYIQACAWLPTFDQRTFSCDVKAAKPAAEIFRRCLAGLTVNPSEILFLDDKHENVRAAEALGIHGVVYASTQQAARDLADRFALPIPLAPMS